MGACWGSAGVTEGLKDILPAFLVVPPAFGLQDEGALGAVCHNEAVHNMVDLAPVTTSLRGTVVSLALHDSHLA